MILWWHSGCYTRTSRWRPHKMLILHSLPYRFQHHEFKTHHPGILTPKSSSTIGSGFIFAFVGWWWIRIRRAPGNVDESFLVLTMFYPKYPNWIYGTVFFLNRTVNPKKDPKTGQDHLHQLPVPPVPCDSERVRHGGLRCLRLRGKAPGQGGARKVRAESHHPKIRENPLRNIMAIGIHGIFMIFTILHDVNLWFYINIYMDIVILWHY